MMKRGVVFGWTAVLLCAACASSVTEHYYVLGAEGPAAPNVQRGLRIAIDAVNLPQLVDRSEMVFQGPEGRITISETERWAEPLRQGIGRVLARDLTLRLGGARVTAFPEPWLEDPEMHVSLDVQSWLIRPAERLSISVLWAVRPVAPAGAAALPATQGRTTLDVPIQGTGTAATLRAQNQALAELADALARAIVDRGGT
jgi:hypothetical protein